MRWLDWHVRRESTTIDDQFVVFATARDVTESRTNARRVRALQLRAEREGHKMAMQLYALLQVNKMSPPAALFSLASGGLSHAMAARVFDKIDVIGNTAHPLYRYLALATNPNGVGRLTVNFEKFLLDGDGKPDQAVPMVLLMKVILKSLISKRVSFLKNNTKNFLRWKIPNLSLGKMP